MKTEGAFVSMLQGRSPMRIEDGGACAACKGLGAKFRHRRRFCPSRYGRPYGWRGARRASSDRDPACALGRHCQRKCACHLSDRLNGSLSKAGPNPAREQRQAQQPQAGRLETERHIVFPTIDRLGRSSTKPKSHRLTDPPLESRPSDLGGLRGCRSIGSHTAERKCYPRDVSGHPPGGAASK